MACFVVLVALEVVAGGISAVAGLCTLAVTAALFLPLGAAGLRSLPLRARLASQAPRRRDTYLHSLASARPGAGAELLREVCAEADSKGWTLALDATGERLVGYYGAFGFEPCSSVRLLPNGEQQLRMRRLPRAGFGRDREEILGRGPA